MAKRIDKLESPSKNPSELESRFWKFLRANPQQSTYMCYAATVAGRKVDVETHFDLIDPEDFTDKDLLVENLKYITSKLPVYEEYEILQSRLNDLRLFPQISQIPKF